MSGIHLSRRLPVGLGRTWGEIALPSASVSLAWSRVPAGLPAPAPPASSRGRRAPVRGPRPCGRLKSVEIRDAVGRGLCPATPPGGGGPGAPARGH